MNTSAELDRVRGIYLAGVDRGVEIGRVLQEHDSAGPKADTSHLHAKLASLMK